MIFLPSRQDKKGKVKVAFCPTMNMIGDFFTKPIQGSTCKRMQTIILNMPGTGKSSAKHRSVLDNEKNKYRKVITKEKAENKNAKTELAYGNKTKRKITRKQDKKGKLKLRMIFAE